MNVPQAIKDAAAAHVAEFGPPAKHPVRFPERGDVIVAHRGDSIRRLVCVTQAPVSLGGNTLATGMLCNSTPEAATDFDMIVRDVTPYPLVVQAELYCNLVYAKYPIVGHIDADRLTAIGRSLYSDGESIERYESGLPLAGPDDPRRWFKKNELDELNQVSFTIGEIFDMLEEEDPCG